MMNLRKKQDISLTKCTFAVCPSVSSLKTKQILRLVLIGFERGSNKTFFIQQGHCKCWHQIFMVCHYPVSPFSLFFLLKKKKTLLYNTA